MSSCSDRSTPASTTPDEALIRTPTKLTSPPAVSKGDQPPRSQDIAESAVNSTNGNPSETFPSENAANCHRRLNDTCNGVQNQPRLVSDVSDPTSPGREGKQNSELASITEKMKHASQSSSFADPDCLKQDRANMPQYPGNKGAETSDRQPKVNYHDIRDHIGGSEDGNRRKAHLENGATLDTVRTVDQGYEARKDSRENSHHRNEKEPPLSHPGFLKSPGYHPGTSSHGLHTPGVVPAHPAYLPQMPFPPGAAGAMHPALLYQYNQYAAGLQLAQLQHMQMAQAAHMAHAAHAQMQASKERSPHSTAVKASVSSAR